MQGEKELRSLQETHRKLENQYNALKVTLKDTVSHCDRFESPLHLAPSLSHTHTPDELHSATTWWRHSQAEGGRERENRSQSSIARTEGRTGIAGHAEEGKLVLLQEV